MNIKPMLERLQSAMGRNDLIEQMVLLPGAASNAITKNKSVNLIVGYNRSPNSQTALDVTLWIAHQTRLATQKQVTVQVVYVVDEDQSSQYSNDLNLGAHARSSSIDQMSLELVAAASRSATPSTQSRRQALAATRTTLIDPSYLSAVFYESDRFEQADQILWQARSLAKEWGEYCKAHLRFGCVSAELRKVVKSEAATLLFLGCSSVNHPVVQKLGADFPCSVLGIPTTLNDELHNAERLRE